MHRWRRHAQALLQMIWCCPFFGGAISRGGGRRKSLFPRPPRPAANLLADTRPGKPNPVATSALTYPRENQWALIPAEDNSSTRASLPRLCEFASLPLVKHKSLIPHRSDGRPHGPSPTPSSPVQPFSWGRLKLTAVKKPPRTFVILPKNYMISIALRPERS